MECWLGRQAQNCPVTQFGPWPVAESFFSSPNEGDIDSSPAQGRSWNSWTQGSRYFKPDTMKVVNLGPLGRRPHEIITSRDITLGPRILKIGLQGHTSSEPQECLKPCKR